MTAGPQEFKKLRYVLADGTVIMEDSARAANFLFFVVFPVCNAEECSIQTFEKARQRTTVWRGNPGAEYLDPDIPDWIDTGDARPNTEPMATESSPGSWLRAFGKVAVNECVEYVIYVDMPGSYSMWISFPLEGVPYGQLYSLDDSEIRLINGDGEVESKANVAVKMHIPVQWKQRPKMTFSLLGTMPEGGAVYPGG
jgi:hypothetical protein